jgi:hypothetical protein
VVCSWIFQEVRITDLRDFDGEIAYFRRMMSERFLGVSTTWPSREPADGPFEHGAFAFDQLLQPRERKLAVGIESVPNGTRHLAYVFLDGRPHSCYVISIQP